MAPPCTLTAHSSANSMLAAVADAGTAHSPRVCSLCRLYKTAHQTHEHVRNRRSTTRKTCTALQGIVTPAGATISPAVTASLPHTQHHHHTPLGLVAAA